MTLRPSLALLLPLVLLAGCNESARNDQRSASGEVYEGTTSDAMLPLDKLKSEPPLLAPSEHKTTPEGVADESSGAEDVTSATSDQPDGATSAATPTPAPAPSASSSNAP